MVLHNNNDDVEAIVIQVLVDELNDETVDHIFQMLMEQQRQMTRLTREAIIRDREDAHERLFNDYFADDSLYTPQMFRRRFRMHKDLFLRIVHALSDHSEYFQLRYNAAGKICLTPLKKCTTAIRQLAYGCPPDTCDDYIKIGETTARECLVNFCHEIVTIFRGRYLRRPTASDVERLLEMHNVQHGFPGANNDINVLRQSPLFNDVVRGYAPEVHFTINSIEYTKGYYLVDGIYPEWATFVKSFPSPLDPKRKVYKKMQEAARKDMERAFGVLQARWGIVRNAARFWDRGNLKEIMYACVIMHNMIVENEGDQITNFVPNIDEGPSITYNQGSIEEFRSTLQRRAEVRDREIHHQLRADLVEHIWQRFGSVVEIN